METILLGAQAAAIALAVGALPLGVLALWFLLADLERLFHGHGVASTDSWYVGVIEPGLAGATAIAQHWHELLLDAGTLTQRAV